MTGLMAYHQTLDVIVQKQLLECLVHGGISLQLANITVPAMTVMLLEIPDMIFRLVPDILLVLSKLSSTVQVAVPVLEFLSSTRRHKCIISDKYSLITTCFSSTYSAPTSPLHKLHIQPVPVCVCSGVALHESLSLQSLHHLIGTPRHCRLVPEVATEVSL